MRGRTWVYDPHSGGRKIPPAVRERTERRIRSHARKHHSGKYSRLDIRFRGALCYIDAFVEPAEPSQKQLRVLRETREQYFGRLREVPIRLCRLRYLGNEGAGVSRSSPTATSAMSPASFTTGVSTARRRRPSMSARPICGRAVS